MTRKRFSIDDILNEFNNKSNLSDLISQFISLQPRGNSFIGKCPFHNEKTPSFNVNNEKGLFYCFGCKVGGNAITFLSKYKNFSFQESIKYLANYAGIILSYEDFSQTKNDKKKYDILRVANDFFQNCLKHNKTASKYLNSRISNLEIIKNFNLGFCPGDKYLIEHLNKNGFSSDSFKSKIGAAGTIPPNSINQSDVFFFINSLSRILVISSRFSCLPAKFSNCGSLLKSSLPIFLHNIGQKLSLLHIKKIQPSFVLYN